MGLRSQVRTTHSLGGKPFTRKRIPPRGWKRGWKLAFSPALRRRARAAKIYRNLGRLEREGRVLHALHEVQRGVCSFLLLFGKGKNERHYSFTLDTKTFKARNVWVFRPLRAVKDTSEFHHAFLREHARLNGRERERLVQVEGAHDSFMKAVAEAAFPVRRPYWVEMQALKETLFG